MHLAKILETCLYVADLDRTEAFYCGLLGLEQIGRANGRHVFFRVGEGVLLCFIASATSRASEKAPHGATGSQHAAFEVPADEYAAWKQRLTAAGIPIVDEVTWRPGVQSVYFHDPDGHLLEIVQPGLWDREPNST
ncbi:MAG TPA: VOC family protein [Planctomycetota bacterium]|nr:VOC family protein [Planctomycetota bacterium]